MKKRLVVPLIGLAISLALPTYAQQNDLADSQTTQKVFAGAYKGWNEAVNNHDAAAVAAHFTRDAVFVTPGVQSSVGKPFRNGIQTYTSGGTPKTAAARWTGMPFT